MESHAINHWNYLLSVHCLLYVALLLSSCTSNHSKQTKETENNNQGINSSSLENELKNDSTHFINSLDIRLVLSDPLFIGSPENMEMELINNSDYKILTGNAYKIKQLEFGFWTILSQFEKIIWTDEGYEIEPKTQKHFTANLDILDVNLDKGNYRLEKEIFILDMEERDELDSKYSILGNRFLEAEFFIK